MNRSSTHLHSVRRLAMTLLVASVFSITGAQAQEGSSGGNSARPEIAKPVQAAIDLLKAKKNKEALAKVNEASAVSGKSAYEIYLVERVKAQAAAAAGDAATAAASFEAAIASPATPANEKVSLLGAAAGQYYVAKNYAKSADTANRYFKEGGTDPALRTLQVQAMYLGGDFAQAGRALQAEIAADEQAGKLPSEQNLQMLADIANRQKESSAFIAAMEKLIAHYPKRDYWASLVYSVSTKPGLSSRLLYDVLRVKLATGTLRTAEEYVEAAQLAIQAGFPAEAKKFVDAGYEANLLGNGADADRHKRLRDTAAKALADDSKTLGQDDAKLANAATGEPLLNTGLNYVLRGQADKGLPLMDQALKKGGFKRLDDAKLHYGMAQYLGGQKAKAVETLRSVRGTDGTAELARLWVLLAQSS